MALSPKFYWLKRVCFVYILLWSGSLFAYRKDLLFTFLGVKEGLSQSSINCILKDRNGFMWFGTLDGLNRYDGLDFTPFYYEVDNKKSLSSSSISCLFEDANGYIWAGAREGGLNRFDTGMMSFHRYQHNANDTNSIISNMVNSICQDRSGNIWVGSREGLDCLDAKSGQFIHYQPNSADSGAIGSREIEFVIADKDGRVWVGLRNMGLALYHPDKGTFEHFRHDPDNDRSIASDMVMNPCLAPDGMIWIGHNQGRLSSLDPKTGQVRRYLLDEKIDRIGSLSADRNGNIWAGTRMGIFFFNPKTGEIINIRANPRLQASLSDDSVACVYVDDSDILWVGVSNYGINKCNLKGKRFINYIHDPVNPNTLGFDFIRGIYENKNGILYIGGYGSLDRYDPQTEKWRHFVVETPAALLNRPNANTLLFPNLGSPAVYCIRPNSDDPEDFLWIGTNGGGLFSFDQKKQMIRPYLIAGFQGRNIYNIYQDSGGFLWFSTGEGLNYYNPKNKTNRYIDLKKEAGIVSQQKSSVDVNLVVPDRDGNLWVGTTLDGVFLYDSRTSKWKNFSHDPNNSQSLSHNRIPTILETRVGDMWIGTYGGGLNRFDRKSGTFEHVNTKYGLPNDVVYSMIEDEKGKIWISTNKGLCRFNPLTKAFRNFSDTDGLIVNEFNSGSYFVNKWTGRIYFGGIKGVTAFFPNEIQDDPYPPSVVIEDLKIFNRSVVPGPGSVLQKPIGEIDSIALTYKHSMLTFEFNALHYIAPAKNRYSYFLEGFDQQWNQTNAQRRYATYTNLNPGHYTLHIKAANSDGVWNETGKTLKIFIAPPFWKTWWFNMLVIVFMGVALFTIYYYRVRGLKKRKTELENLVALRTQELKEMSLRDPMTNLHNRRYVSEVVMDEMRAFVDQWKLVVKNGQRRKVSFPQSSMGIAIIDVDFFKAINDKYGHKAGDLFLNEFASILRKCVRRDDVVVRWGGEEFLVILKNCDMAFLTVVAEKIRKMVENNEFRISATEELFVRSSCSIGIVRFPFVENLPDLVSFDHAAMLADMAMYLGKENGRNRTIYLEYSGLIPDKEEIQKFFYAMKALKGSGFIKIHEFNSSCGTQV